MPPPSRSAAVPVVASGHDGMAEAFEHGVDGLLFAPGDSTDLAGQFRRLIDEPDLWERLAIAPQVAASFGENTTQDLQLNTASVEQRR